MNDNAARMTEAEQAKAAMDRFLSPALAACRLDYVEKLGDIAAKPMTDNNRAAMEKLAVAVKVIDQVATQLQEIIVDGKVAKHEAERAARIAGMTTEQRKWAWL